MQCAPPHPPGKLHLCMPVTCTSSGLFQSTPQEVADDLGVTSILTFSSFSFVFKLFFVQYDILDGCDITAPMCDSVSSSNPTGLQLHSSVRLYHTEYQRHTTVKNIVQTKKYIVN